MKDPRKLFEEAVVKMNVRLAVALRYKPTLLSKNLCEKGFCDASYHEVIYIITISFNLTGTGSD